VASAAAAVPSKIVYVCDPNLCVVDPATGIISQVTTDGASYRAPSLSADGTRLAASRGLDVVVGAFGGNLTERWGGSQGLNDVALAPSGAAVVESHSYVANRFGCPLTGGCLELVDESGATFSVGPLGAGGEKAVRGGGGVGFLGAGAMLTSYYTISGDTHTVCGIPNPLADTKCAPQINSVGRYLGDPAGSPDGRLIAATTGDTAPGGVQNPTINLYDGASGAFVRSLAAGSNPAFSPDSSEVAYEAADGWVHLISVQGGGDRRLVAGSDPTWAGAPAPQLRSLPKALAYRNGKVKLRLRCAGPTPCRGQVQLRKGKTALARAKFLLAPGSAKAVAVKPTKRGRKVIAGKSQRVTVRVRLDGGKAVSKKVTLKG
jgi:hypothetical protein